MIYDPSTAQHLKPWLVRTLEPVCDAEPGALADYILALLKHNVSESEMRKELVAQLDEFLEKECSPFVDTLFTVLRTKSYLPYATESSPSKPVDVGIPIPLDLITPPAPDSGNERGRKRNMEEDERDGRPPVKGHRVNSEGQFSRYGNGAGPSSGYWEGMEVDGRGHGYMNGGMDVYNMQMMGDMGHMNGGRRPQSYQPPDQKRGICRDYHKNGYCARGMMCKFSHGDDAVVPGQLFPMAPGLPFMPIFPGGIPFGPGIGYDPNDSRIDMRPRHQRAPMLNRIQQEGGVAQASGELPVIQDLTPSITKDSAELDPSGSQSQSQGVRMTQVNQTQLPQPSQQMDLSYDLQLFSGMQPMPPMPYMPVQPQTETDTGVSHRGGFRGRGRGRGRGTFGGEVHNFRPERKGDKTLVVEKIPEDKLSLEGVNDWFKRFGTVTNVAIDKSGGKALVSFSTHEEAHAAWKSEDAVFNNRFVKIFWHRPMEGQGQAGAKMLAASASVVANMGGNANSVPTPAVATSMSAATPTPRKPSVAPPSSAISALAAKQQLLEQQIAEQKSLMASLESATSEEKKNIMARLRKLGEEMKATSTPSGPSSQKTTPAVEDSERKRLDGELGHHGGVVSTSSAPESTEKQETAEELKAKLEKLKAEAESLGLNAETASDDWHASAPYRGGYRGRARGRRGFFRGVSRGAAPPRFNMTLDNRPKKLRLQGVKTENVQAVRDWYETTGQMDSIDMQENGDVVVTFKTRAAAEQGLGKGPNIPTVGQVQISWYTEKPSVASSQSTSIDKPGVSPTTKSLQGGETRSEGSRHTPEPDAEEEMVARGWGGDDDGDGMGML